MDLEKLQKYIKIAKDAVKDESEPYKTEGYKIILEKLLNDSSEIKQLPDDFKKNIQNKDLDQTISDRKKGIEELAKHCNISVNQLEDVITINNKNEIEIIAPIQGNDSKKHIIVTLCILVATEFIKNEEWVESTKIAEALRSIGTKDISNLSLTLKRYPLLTRTRGSRGQKKQYRLTTNDGRTKAFEIIEKIAKGEMIDV